jgi:hypothetical protein
MCVEWAGWSIDSFADLASVYSYVRKVTDDQLIWNDINLEQWGNWVLLYLFFMFSF